jgi:SAM-dependent methyltransferase
MTCAENNDSTYEEKLVISKQRVADHGEVLTGKREVNAMLDLVKSETERIDSRFLEPACGNGNFLAVILERKLAVVERRYGKAQLDFERYAVLAISSLYGIDILSDNVSQCRERLFDVFDGVYERLFPKTSKAGCREAVRFILARNIVWGDALTFLTGGETPKPIVFSEWSFVHRSLLKRRDFTFRGLLEHETVREHLLFPELKKKKSVPQSLFSDHGDDVFLPPPIREYPPTYFLELGVSANESE